MELGKKKPEDYRLIVYGDKDVLLCLTGGEDLKADLGAIRAAIRLNKRAVYLQGDSSDIGIMIDRISHFVLESPTPPF
jgi:hypothetical protein